MFIFFRVDVATAAEVDSSWRTMKLIGFYPETTDEN